MSEKRREMADRNSSFSVQRSTWKNISFQQIQTASVFILILVFCTISAMLTPTFLTWRNLVDNLLTNAACLGIIACGMTLVMIAGGFDLSVGATTAVCSVVAVLLLNGVGERGGWMAFPVALGGTLLVGVLLGAVNGVLVSYLGVNPFVVTLSTLLVFRGLALILTYGGQSIEVPLSLRESSRLLYWGQANLFGGAHGVSIPILIFVGVFIVCLYLLHLTRFGRYLYAVGGNENASWLAGINTSFVKAVTYTICGLTCAITALIYSAQSNTAQAASYQGLEMKAIASVIVGGTPLGGGSGNLFRTLNGLLLLLVIENLLTQFGVPEEYRNIMSGVVILVVVTTDVLVRRTGKERA